MKKICKQSGREFEISDADLEYYEKIKVPLPTLSPDARHQRRTAKNQFAAATDQTARK